MSRRGRGAFRGRGGRGGTQKIGGLEVTFDSQLEYGSPQPTPTYPVSAFFHRLHETGDRSVATSIRICWSGTKSSNRSTTPPNPNL